MGKFILPRIDLAPSETPQLSSALKRQQYPIIPALTVITPESQMQTSKPVGIYREQPVFLSKNYMLPRHMPRIVTVQKSS